MFDLNEQPSLPEYELKLKSGETKSFDTLLISYKLQALDGEKDPEKIQEIINKAFEVNVDSFTAMIILKDFTAFSEQHLEEPLKKVFGPELFSAISMGSRPKSSDDSVQPSTSD